MKRFSKLLVLATFLLGWVLPSWSQAPSTEGRDFWVTFLRAADDDPTELKLTISARDSCEVLIENTNTGFSLKRKVGENSSTELTIAKANCYSSANETAKYTALHVSASKDISLFAGNYRDKSFDATNVLPTASLLDDYVIQTYPPSDHENKPQGSHFAIIAVEDGETVVDYTLPDGVQTAGNKTGTQTATLQKGQVWYVWTGKNEGEKADLSSTTVQARDKKKIAVFQGCPHTNIPYSVRDRDHIISQAMPTAYWGTEFGITASSHHRRDIVAVMALNDETKVYINDEKGNKQLVHTFDFNTDKKHYWTFEIGDSLAYCADNEGQSPSHGKLPYPLVIDSSCYLTTSCPAGVHLFMVSNRYDNAVEKVSSDTLISDPAMLWISPIEQVIKEINFSTYSTKQDSLHFMNILTTTGNVPTMEWNGQSIKQYFHKLRGNPDYSFARILIQDHHLDKDKLVNHHLKGELGFLAHVYGYGERESYAYSCGSSTVERSISFNDDPLLIDSISPRIFCINEDIKMKLNIGNNDYETVEWDFGDGVSEYSEKGENTIMHTYTNPGWYDLTVKAKYVNPCTGKEHNDTLGVTFLVWRSGKQIGEVIPKCIEADSTIIVNGVKIKLTPDQVRDSLLYGSTDTIRPSSCDKDTIINYITYGLKTKDKRYGQDTIGFDQIVLNDSTYTLATLPPGGIVEWTGTNNYNCDSLFRFHAIIRTCLDIKIPNVPDNQHICLGEKSMSVGYNKIKGDIDGDTAVFTIAGMPSFRKTIKFQQADSIEIPLDGLTRPGYYTGKIAINDANCINDESHPEKPEFEFPIDFSVNYPEDIFDFKFTNVLAVRKDAGYNFRNYQWYINGKPVGGDVSVLYLGEGVALKNNDLVYVKLTDQSGMVLESCPKTIQYKEGQLQPNKAPARKVMQNQRIYILCDEQVYDIFGQKVK